jgi:hypothetical protein
MEHQANGLPPPGRDRAGEMTIWIPAGLPSMLTQVEFGGHWKI